MALVYYGPSLVVKNENKSLGLLNVCTHTLSVIAQYGETALILAAREGNTDVVVELVRGGANLDLQNKVC